MSLLFIVFLITTPAMTAFAQSVTPPAASGTASAGNPLGGVSGFYTTALAVGGLLAFGAIVYAALQYALARGNPGMQSDAREGITQAILGLLLLIGSFLILRTINPALLSPSLPPPAPTGGPTSGTSTDPTRNCRVVSIFNYRLTATTFNGGPERPAPYGHPLCQSTVQSELNFPRIAPTDARFFSIFEQGTIQCIYSNAGTTDFERRCTQ